MTEDRAETYQSLDLALRIGEILARSGAGAADVTATMLAVTHACGVRRVSADVTFIDLALHFQPSADEPATIRIRRVIRRPVDYELLTQTDRVVRQLVDGTLNREQAHAAIARLVSVGHKRRRWAVTLGLGVMGVGIALRLGGTPTVCALAFLAACGIDRIQLVLSRRLVPMFYQQAAGGLFATVIALLAAGTSLEANPSRVITAGIVMMLAGIGLMGATQDAILGFPVTASARMLEATLATVGIIGGVSAGLALRDVLGVNLVTFHPGAMGLSETGVSVLGSAIAAAAFGYSSYASGRALVAIAVVAGVAATVSAVVGNTNLGVTFGVTIGAVVIGAVSLMVANRVGVPPLVIVVPSIVPMLPGLSIYTGLALLAEGKDGVPDLVTAGVTAVALASGVILGQYLSQPLRQEAHRWETRLSGPRLVGAWRGRFRAVAGARATRTERSVDD